mmetsp:Transcript_12980/g.19696  ORF Transcript_12980/g.19696 Transcript_12980/m.19696 type:complete len:486 (+) Transcript_12980:98-1555(+)
MVTRTISSANMLLPTSELHSKGIMTLVLLILSESITVSNSVSFWSQYQNANRMEGSRGRNFFEKQTNVNNECVNNDEILSGRAKITGAPVIPSLPRSRLKRAAAVSSSCGDITDGSGKMDACCRECVHCLSTSQARKLCEDGSFRGGSTEEIVTNTVKAASAAASVASSPSPYNIPLYGWKLIFQFFLTTLNILCWLVPLRAKAISENKVALSLANAFSGGVFLSLAFGHLIPACAEGFQEAIAVYQDGNPGSSLQLNEAIPYMMVLAGYMLIFFVEKVAFDAEGILDEMQEQHHHQSDVETISNKNNNHANSNSHQPSNNSKTVKKDEQQETSTGGKGALVLLAALAIHSILEMSALGLAKSWGDAAIMSLSIALHQPAESIALLVAFLKSGLSKQEIFRFLMVFSMMGPVGVGMGMAVSSFASPIIDSIMLAVVAGTFIYVGATEVIPEEWEEPEYKWSKFGFLMSGIISIFFITQYTMTLES